MSRIADSSLEAIRQRVDIAELVREYVPGLKQAGRAWKARCPFHQEKTPSFTVNVERQIFHCFGCQEGGDAFKFLMKMENMTFPEAVAKLGERVGVEVAPRNEALGPQERERLKLRDALSFAREFFARALAGPQASAARRYLDSRGLDAATRERFGVGFAPGEGAALLEAGVRKGFGPELLAKAGLVILRDNGRYGDFFRGRIAYPITSVRGETIGFGARAMGDSQPKYLNGPDSPVFAKGKVLYGIYEGLSEVRKSRRALLLEGYMDVLAAHQFGAKTACAPLGTAVTPEHAALLKRYADEVVFVFDPDNAGSSAALRGAELLLGTGLLVRIATVPDGLDPDELLHKSGVRAFQDCLDRAQDLPDFQTERALAGRKGLLTSSDKARIAGSVLASIAKADNEVLRGEWVRRLGNRLDVSEQSLLLELGRLSGKAAPARPVPRHSAAPAPRPEEPMPDHETAVLKALLAKPALAAQGGVVAADFMNETARLLLSAIVAAGEDQSGEGRRSEWTSAFLAALPEALAGTGRKLALEAEGVVFPDKIVEDWVEGLRLWRRYRELDAEVKGGTVLIGSESYTEYKRLLKRVNDKGLLVRFGRS